VIPASCDYIRAASVDEAVQALGNSDDAKVLAGGQSLIPLMRLRLSFPELLVDVGRIDELRGISDVGDGLRIAATTTLHEVMTDPLVRQHVPLLAEATSTVADPAVRHRGTFGGTLAHADPAGDLPACALALDAVMEIAGPAGRRRVPAAEFFVDYLQTAVGPEDILVATHVPKLGGGWGASYEKFNRVAQAWAIVGVAALVRRDNGSITEARIGLTNMGTTPLRARATEQALAGSASSADMIRSAADTAAEGTTPPSDLNGQADYRQHLARVLTRRAVARAAGVQ
jgi:aerobic carbon-monoxide dehydrogenase medium subunit